ncbi:hypothetical protein HMPREF0305_10496 [Corynebacterium pseudogenitalium ATCC 33035]|uniref:Uncharacterized protein n=1 Tax=Corynebacterium pseudogenitalium ATCC 33035 TaxID=525264 RepID=E2S1U4_9CORY|nr:hypothetical protein HMPREF0305_10496 [Corynebacterium pseudogenitalium ATCC 33035]
MGLDPPNLPHDPSTASLADAPLNANPPFQQGKEEGAARA